jgi:hypothetical protein
MPKRRERRVDQGEARVTLNGELAALGLVGVVEKEVVEASQKRPIFLSFGDSGESEEESSISSEESEEESEEDGVDLIPDSIVSVTAPAEEIDDDDLALEEALQLAQATIASWGSVDGKKSEEVKGTSIMDKDGEDNFDPRLIHIHAQLAIRRLEERMKLDSEELETGEISNIRKVTQDLHEQLMAKELRRERNQIALKAAIYAKGNTKAIASQYVRKQDVADNAAKRAIVHHTGSHYVMLHGKNYQSGNRLKGVVSRHSKQAALRQQKSKDSMLKARDVARGITGPSGKSGGKTVSKKKKSQGGARPKGTKK